jgi:hypothetical protein
MRRPVTLFFGSAFAVLPSITSCKNFSASAGLRLATGLRPSSGTMCAPIRLRSFASVLALMRPLPAFR